MKLAPALPRRRDDITTHGLVKAGYNRQQSQIRLYGVAEKPCGPRYFG